MYEPKRLGVVGQELNFIFTMIDLELRRSHPPPSPLTNPIEWGEGGRNQGKIVDGKRIPVRKALNQLIVGADGFVSDSVRLEVMRMHYLYEECLYVLYTIVPDTSPAHYNIQQAMNEAESIDFNLFKWNHVCSSFAEAEQARKFEENSRVISRMMLEKDSFTDAQIVRFLFSAYRRARLDEWQKKEYFQQSFTNIFGKNKHLTERLSGFFFSAQTLPYECILAKVLALLPSNDQPETKALMDPPQNVQHRQIKVKKEKDANIPNETRTATSAKQQTCSSSTGKLPERADVKPPTPRSSSEQKTTKSASSNSTKAKPPPRSSPLPPRSNSTNARAKSPKRKREAEAGENTGNTKGKRTVRRPVIICKFGLNDPERKCYKRSCSFKHLPRSRYRAEVCEIRRCDMACGKTYHNPFSNFRRRSKSPQSSRRKYSNEPASDRAAASNGNGNLTRRSSHESSSSYSRSKETSGGTREELIDSITKSVMKEFEKKLQK